MERARPAAPGDAPRVVELCSEALAEVTARRGGGQLARAVLGGLAVPEWLAAALASDRAQVVVGELGDAVMGVGVVRAAAGPAGGTATVDLLFVEPGARGVGLGEVIMDALCAWAEGEGCDGLDAAALPGSREAKAFFETHGMVARALIMHRSLQPRAAVAGPA